MTITTTTSMVSWSGDGQKTIFEFNFMIPENAIEVYLTENGVEKNVPNQDYGVSGFGEGKGTVTFNVAPTVNQTVTIRRVLQPTQAKSLMPAMSTYVETVEGVLDHQAMVMQQLQNDVSRAVKAPIGSALNPEETVKTIEDAVVKAEAAQDAAKAAEAGAVIAQGLAEKAQQDAVVAQNAAVGAKNDAVTAQGLAENAKTSAEGYAEQAKSEADRSYTHANRAEGEADRAQRIVDDFESRVSHISGILHVREEQPSGTNGGTFATGSYIPRVLNTIKENSIQGASVASNRISVPAGKYKIQARASQLYSGVHKARLQSINGVTLLLGNSTWGNMAYGEGADAIVQGVVTFTAPTVFELQHRCDRGFADVGFGRACAFGDVEVYSEVVIEKIA